VVLLILPAVAGIPTPRFPEFASDAGGDGVGLGLGLLPDRAPLRQQHTKLDRLTKNIIGRGDPHVGDVNGQALGQAARITETIGAITLGLTEELQRAVGGEAAAIRAGD
jgi:hypothetical protein